MGPWGGPGGHWGPWGPWALGGPPIFPLFLRCGEHLRCILHWSPTAWDSNLAWGVGWVGVDTSGGGVGTTTRRPPARRPPAGHFWVIFGNFIGYKDWRVDWPRSIRDYP